MFITISYEEPIVLEKCLHLPKQQEPIYFFKNWKTMLNLKVAGTNSHVHSVQLHIER